MKQSNQSKQSKPLSYYYELIEKKLKDCQDKQIKLM